MPITKEASKHGVLGAVGLALVRRAFDTACEQCLSNPDPHLDAETMAKMILAAYHQGVYDENELVKVALASTTMRQAANWG
jgi:hypothetical protein